MLSSQYKNLLKYAPLYKNNYKINHHKNQSQINKRLSSFDLFVNKYEFGKNKPIITSQKQQKQIRREKKEWEQSQFLWRVSLALNILGMGAGFYFPKEALIFVVTSGSMFQVYESSKSIILLKELIEKGVKGTSQESVNVLPEIRQQLKKIVISMGFLLAASITIGLGLNYPSLRDYSLLGLNFWILFNIKFNGLSHGYYFVLLTLAAFQYLYFQNVFESNKQKIPFQ